MNLKGYFLPVAALESGLCIAAWMNATTSGATIYLLAACVPLALLIAWRAAWQTVDWWCRRKDAAAEARQAKIVPLRR